MSLEETAVEDFAAVTPGYEANARHALKFYQDEDSTMPAWCFVLLDGETPVARAAFWSFGLEKNAVTPFCLSLPWEEEGLKTGIELLQGCFDRLTLDGVHSVEARLNSDSPLPVDRLTALYDAAGFALEAKREQYLLPRDSWHDCQQRCLRYHSIEETGQREFTALVAGVSHGTLDSMISSEIEHMGPQAAAGALVASLKAQDFNPSWWLTATDDRDRAVGLVIAQQLDKGYGTVNYLGVVPSMRGQGHGRELLDKGISLLLSSGLEKVVVDVDLQNGPVRAALCQAGFSLRRATTVFRRVL